MYVRVDLTEEPTAVTLEEPDDCKRFHVAVVGPLDTAAVDAALRESEVGRLADEEHALVEIAAVQRLATGRVGPTWDQDFGAMLDYARGKGWVDEDERSVLGHLEPGTSA
jgi:hypothetical protein